MNTRRSIDWQTILIGIILAYPFTDLIIRDVLHVPVLSSLWDELALLLLLLAVGVRWLIRSDERRSPVGRAIGTVMLIALIWVALDTDNMGTAIEGYRAVYEYMLVFFAAFFLLRDKRQLQTFLVVLTVVGTIMALHGVFQFVTGVPTPGSWTDASESIRARAFSIVGSPNALGSQLAFTVPIALALAWREQRWIWRLLWLAAAGVSVLGLLLTFSRGAWLAMAGAFFLLGLIWDRRILIGMIAMVLLVGTLVQPVRERVTYLFSEQYIEKSQNDGRIARWLDAYDQMRDEPVFGQGLGRYGGAVAERRYGTTYVDNYYMKTLAETGLFGLGLFLWLQGLAVWQMIQVWRRESNMDGKVFLSGLLAAVIALLLHNGVENIFEIPYLNLYYWVTVGWLLAWPYLPDRSKEGSEA